VKYADVGDNTGSDCIEDADWEDDDDAAVLDNGEEEDIEEGGIGVDDNRYNNNEVFDIGVMSIT